MERSDAPVGKKRIQYMSPMEAFPDAPDSKRRRRIRHCHHNWWECWGITWWGWDKNQNKFVRIYGIRYYPPFHVLDIFIFRKVLSYVHMYEIFYPKSKYTLMPVTPAIFNPVEEQEED